MIKPTILTLLLSHVALTGYGRVNDSFGQVLFSCLRSSGSPSEKSF